MNKTACDFLSFQKAAPTACHAAAQLARMLARQGYQRLFERDAWTLQPGGRYFLIRGDTSLIAFSLPQETPAAVRITAAHSDSPAFKLRPEPALRLESRYVRLDVEPYGGAIYSSWLDRPLSVAGRLVVREGDRLVTKLVQCEQDLCLIPNLAIHMNRDANKGMEYKAHVDMVPLWGSGDSGSWLETVAAAAGVSPDSVVSHDLFLYSRTPGSVWGDSGEFISAPRLDDLMCAWAAVRSMPGLEDGAASVPPDTVAMACVFDHEEVGSLSRTGADGSLLSDTVLRIADSLGLSPEDTQRMIAGSFLVSADNAHAVHPNHPEFSDPANRVWMNGGVVIKHSAQQKYVTEALSDALFTEVCRRADVPVQHYVNRADLPGGSTLGRLAVGHLSIPAVDIGLAQLAMHSSYETAGARDLDALCAALRAYYELPFRLTGDGEISFGGSNS